MKPSLGRFRPFRQLKRVLPSGLFWRSLIIIVAPVVLLQAVVSYVFFERDVYTTTRWMARDVAADMAMLIAIEDKTPKAARDSMLALSARMLGYRVSFVPGATLTPPPSRRRLGAIDTALHEVIAQQIGDQRNFTTESRRQNVDIRIQARDGVLEVAVPRNRTSVSKPDIFLVWMVGSAIILASVAILFLRNQVRPIERLALASEAFGKGRSVPDFKPYGASEVRRAARAFLTMRERIERHVQQRTEMLAGVSHDLKTPLTRMRLALAMMEDSQDVAALRDDIGEMEHMLDEYLEFARGEGGEQPAVSDLGELAREAANAAAKARSADERRISLALPQGIAVTVRPRALKRCMINLVDNALKHGSRIAMSVDAKPHVAEVSIDDDGPGIDETKREEAFRPFHRLDVGRNLQAGGVGLGLAIARDIARSHGGEVLLGRSAMGGLRATLRLPV
ncbi:MAG: HAMP domain-containing protein [Alphaproteobacteria bacterium]|nr:HAMP domain-containing protein [Alphaproteobacteria bacterium]